MAAEGTAGGLPVDPDLGPVGRPRHGRRWDVALVVAAGGALGGAARWGVNELWPTRPGGFPWSTFAENVSGCLLLGALMVYLLEVMAPRRYARPFLGIGVLGGYTTFSAYTAETSALLRDGHAPVALVYLFGTVAAAVVATWAGLTLARSAAAVTHPRTRRSSP